MALVLELAAETAAMPQSVPLLAAAMVAAASEPRVLLLAAVLLHQDASVAPPLEQPSQWLRNQTSRAFLAAVFCAPSVVRRTDWRQLEHNSCQAQVCKR